MLKLAEKNETYEDMSTSYDNTSGYIQTEEDKRQTRIRYLEIMIEDEREQIAHLKMRLEKQRENVTVSLILIGISIIILIAIGANAVSLVMALIRNPIVAILIVGTIVKFIESMVRHAIKHIPMYIWCRMEQKGKIVKHDNFVRQYRKHIEECEKLENELKELAMTDNGSFNETIAMTREE